IPRHLPSFPTRRSSDLSRAVPAEGEAAKDEKKQAARQGAIAEGRLTPEEFAKAFEATPKAWYKQLANDLDGCATQVEALDELGRSEEHTSELQSQSNLV